MASEIYNIDDIVDRVGAGDAFISGIIYGIMKQKELSYTIDFACCAAVLKHTIRGDVNLFTVDDIEQFMQHGITRIQR